MNHVYACVWVYDPITRILSVSSRKGLLLNTMDDPYSSGEEAYDQAIIDEGRGFFRRGRENP